MHVLCLFGEETFLFLFFVAFRATTVVVLLGAKAAATGLPQATGKWLHFFGVRHRHMGVPCWLVWAVPTRETVNSYGGQDSLRFWGLRSLGVHQTTK